MPEEKDPLCIPTEPCSVETPYGTLKGKKCPIDDKAYHNTIVDRAVKIGESGDIKPGQHPGALGEDVISLSSCPTQGYGGNVKFVLKSEKLQPMCYYEYSDNKEVDRGIEKEARQDINGMAGANRIRGKYGVNLSMYEKECEYVANEPILLKENLEKIEYWIPWKLRKFSFNHACKGHLPGYANVDGYEKGISVMQEQIERTKKTAEKLGVPFEVKSCFTALKASWGDRYIPLTEENLKKIASGKISEAVQGKIPQKCRC